MNALTEFNKQIVSLFASLTPSARIMAGLMLGVIIISLGWIFTSQQTTSYTFLFGGKTYSDSELELWEATFSDAELRDWDRVGQRIRVPTAEKDLYLKALSGASVLPKAYGEHMEKALASSSPWDPYAMVEKRAESAKEREVGELIKRIPGINFAAVDFDQAPNGFARNTLRVCSVSVQAVGSMPVTPEKLRLISQMVQGHFAGLTPDNITVTDLGGTQQYRASGDPLAADENPYLKAQTEFERAYMQKISSVLSNYGDVQLAVNVELDPRLQEESEKLQYDPTAVTLQSLESRKDQENTKPAPAGQPGPASNGVSNQPQSINTPVAGQSSNSKENQTEEKRVAGHEAIITKTAGLVPRKVNVSVGIPESYYRKVWNYNALLNATDPQNPPVSPPPPTAAEFAALKTEIDGKVRSAIEGLPVGIREGDDRLPFIKVYSYTDLPLPDFPEPTLTETATSWLADSWSTLALLGVVLVSLGMVFSWVRAQKPGETDAKFAEGFGLEIPEMSDELIIGDGQEIIGPDGQPIGDDRRKPAFDLTGGEIKEDLSTLIKENPDAAVNLLKAWIGEAM